jgi:hypothetical protein
MIYSWFNGFKIKSTLYFVIECETYFLLSWNGNHNIFLTVKFMVNVQLSADSPGRNCMEKQNWQINPRVVYSVLYGSE